MKSNSLNDKCAMLFLYFEDVIYRQAALLPTQGICVATTPKSAMLSPFFNEGTALT